MDKDCTCHYLSRYLSFLDYQVVGLASPTAYSSPGSPLSLTQVQRWGGSGAPLPTGPGFLLISGAESVRGATRAGSAGGATRAGSAGGAGAAFHVFLNGQSLTEWSSDPHARHSLLAKRQLR